MRLGAESMKKAKVFIYQYTESYMSGIATYCSSALDEAEQADRKLVFVGVDFVEFEPLSREQLVKANDKNKHVNNEVKRLKLEAELEKLSSKDTKAA